VRVAADGSVKEAQLGAPRDGFAALEQQALEAARTYRFDPQQTAAQTSDVWLTLPVRFRPTPPGSHLVIKGSDTLGATLLPAWVDALRRKRPRITVDNETLGSTTGLAALLDGSADIATSSRLVRADELALAERMGVQLRETFVGYDGLALIVHPNNPLSQLDLDALAKIYVRRIRNWSELGGPDAPIHVLGRPGYSGLHRLFKERVLSRLGPDTTFGAHVDALEKSSDVLAAVAADPLAIGYVSMGLSTNAVRMLGLASQPGGDAIAPSQSSVRDGSYALAHPLILYARPDSGEAAQALLDLALSTEGQALVNYHGFVSVPAGSPQTLGQSQGPALQAQPLELIRIYFDPNSARVAHDSQPDLLAAIASVRARRSVIVLGNADSSGTDRENQLLAQRRADVVAAQLRAHGSHQASITVQVAAADHPIASNTTQDGRRLNRRVDVIIQPPTH
jgi:phosphate transport system substrate-binding protein